MEKILIKILLSSIKKEWEYIDPTEFLVRTMLGSYPELILEQKYENANVLDLGCGDGRNMLLLHNLGMKIHAMEITEEICNGVSKRMHDFSIEADIRVGRNSKIPFDSVRILLF
jgi:predicted RNA methylase